MSILAISVTTIECDGRYGTTCPNDAVVEFERPQSVAIRLAQNSGWTVWIETTCPECSKVPAVVTATAPAAPVMLQVSHALSGAEDAVTWCSDMKAQRPRVPAAA